MVGLGNPGEAYSNNRHNAGYVVLDALASRGFLGSKDIIFAKTNTFMNTSGEAVKKLVSFYKIKLDDLYVIHDDLDIALGEYRIQKGIGPKDHKGIASIERVLGSSDFWRVRIGIENRSTDNRPSGGQFVLDDFTNEERRVLDGVIEKIINEQRFH